MSKGSLVVITGPMYSRKSLELIEEIKNWKYRELPYMAFSPIKDEIFSRGSTHKVPAIHIAKEHSGIISYNTGTAIRNGNNIKAVAIDEVSFYDEGIVNTVMSLLENGIDVVVAGLDKDFRGRPFGSIGDLMALAIEVRKRYTICMKCKKAMGTMTQRLMEDGLTPASFNSQLIAVDGKDIYKYECRCKDCHERG
jgi:thymidine kinase